MKTGRNPKTLILQFAIPLVIFLLFAQINPAQASVESPQPLPSAQLHTDHNIQSDGPQPALRFSHLTIEDGLSNNGVTAIWQDRQGFMWIGTEDGLNRFDGYEFTVFRTDPDNPNSLSGNSITDIYEDSTGKLWVAAKGAGVSRFDPQTETFTRYRYEPGPSANSLAGDTIRSIFEDHRGHIWFGGLPTKGQSQLTRFDPVSETFTRYLAESASPEASQRGAVWDIIEDKDGYLWLAADFFLTKFDPETETFTHYKPESGDRRLSTLYLDEDGLFWMSGSRGVYQFDPQTEVFVRHMQDQPIDDILANDDGTWWVSTGNGLYRFDPAPSSGQAPSYHYRHDATDTASLSADRLTVLYRDRGGVLWIASNKGLNLYDPGQRQFAYYRHEPENDQSLAAGTVWSMAGEDRRAGSEDNLWLGTDVIINRLDLDTGAVTHYPLDPIITLPRTSPSGAIYNDPDGFVWVGLGSRLYRLDKTSGEFKSYDLQTVALPNAAPNEIVGLYRNGPALLIGVQRGGLIRFDLQTETFEPYLDPPPERQGIPDPHFTFSQEISTLYGDRDGAIWLGYTTGGISRLDPNTSTFKHFFPDPEKPQSIPEAWITGIYQDRDGNLWLTSRRGLIGFDLSTENFHLFTEKDGLPSAYVTAIQQDQSGALWLATTKGLSRFDIQTETFRNYDPDDGVGSTEFSGASWQSADGRIFFGGSEGLTAFYPGQISDNPYQPPVVLTTLYLFHNPVIVGSASLLQQPIWETEHLTLQHDQTSVSFEFAALSYAAAHKNRYRYILEGVEKEWHEVDSAHRLVTFTNLPAGEHVFRVQGSNKDGVWSNAEVLLEITVLPPWWETTWFRILAGVLLVSAIFGAFRWRVYAIQKRNRELEAEVETRTNELLASQRLTAALEERERIGRDLHDDLGQVMGYVSVQAQAALQRLARSEVEEAQGILTQLADIAQGAAAKVRQYILGIRTTADRPPGDFFTELEQLADSQKQIYDLEVSLSRPADWQISPFSPDVERQLLRIIQEALTNARKHAGVSLVSVLFTQIASAAQVIVADEGQGFDRQAQSDESEPGHFGLTIMRERAESVGGSLEVRTEPGLGTQVVVTVPLVLEPAKTGPSARDVRVLLVDDHPLYLEGLRNLLASRGFQVIGQANDGRQALEKARTLYPDLILMDVQMPNIDGVEATRQIKAELPEVKIVMLTMGSEDETLFAALKNGADGYLLKSMPGDQFFNALTGAIAGETVFSPSLAAQVLLEFSQRGTPHIPDETSPELTNRQREILELAAAGLSNKEIAAQIYISETTVKYHIRQILDRLQLKSRHEFRNYLNGEH